MQNLAPGVVERLGLGGDDLRAERPELIVVEHLRLRLGGPLKQRKAYDMLVQAESGMVAVTGTPETPVKTGIPTADIAAGMYTAMSVARALLRRGAPARVRRSTSSMFDAAVEWMGHAMYMQMYTGRQLPRMGLSHSAIAPYDGYPDRATGRS